jgi:DeoR family glycerol-3-phosphate regulon repressor
MRPRDRQSLIIDTVRAQGKVAVGELAEMFDTSVETIRRDLSSLARNGKIDKIHGGATSPKNIGEGPFDQRMQQNGGAKRHIAQKAIELVSPGDTLLIDTGSTTLVFAEQLAAIDDLIVVTNSTAIARVVAAGNKTAKLFLLGGNYNEENRQTCGTMALEQLQQFSGNLVILTAGAVAADNGVMDYNFDEAQIARAMLQRAARKIVLCDSSKFGNNAPFVVSRLDEIDDLVCEQAPAGLLSENLRDARVNVIY